MEIIKLEGITKVYRTTEVETTALENVNLTVRKGEFLSIMGPSGCGKSTLLNLMGLLDLPDQGKILIKKTEKWLSSGTKCWDSFFRVFT